MKKNKVLIIGWDAADWKAINPLMDKGLMPHLNGMVDRGAMGKLATLNPPLSPMLWTSVATGKRPYKHGILGFTEPKPDGSGIQPVLNTSRKCKAIWNILHQEGYKSHVVGWWPSHPAEPIRGSMISNFYQKAHLPKEGNSLTGWPLMKGTIHPPTFTELFAKLRVHPLELTEAHILPFVPSGPTLDMEDKNIKKLLKSLRNVIAHCATIQSAITYIIENEDWDFAAVYFDGIDHFGHGFMKFHPPKREHIDQKLYDAFNNVITAGYRFHDMMLGNLLRMVGEETTVMLISDHGFHPDELRPEALPNEPAGPAHEHSPYGIIVVQGPDIKKDQIIYGASLLDITPTLLSYYNLPVGRDMDGKVLDAMFTKKSKVDFIDSWEDIAAPCGMHSKDIIKDPFIDQEAIEQLVELGYIEKPDENAEKAINKSQRETQFWLAQSYVDGSMYPEAVKILEKLFYDNPDHTRYGFLLINCYRHINEPDKARKALLLLKASNEMIGPNALLLEARLHALEGRYSESIKALNQAEPKIDKNPDLYLQLGHTYAKLKDWIQAEKAFKRCLKLDSQNHAAYYGLGLTNYRSGRFEKAAHNFVESLSLLFSQPYAHYYLGESLYELQDYNGAAKAFETALGMDENVAKARNKLAQTYSKNLEKTELGHKVTQELLDKIENEMIIVSGLPRTGTSMMMQILERGGIECFTDKKRNADESNPMGYYEHTGIKKLGKDKSILNEVGNKAVKIIAQLLFSLPLRFRYKIIFMHRDLDEVLASQKKMLERLKESNPKINVNRDTKKLKAIYKNTLERILRWEDQLHNVEILNIKYVDMIKNPELEISRVQSFLDRDMDQKAMKSAVEPKLRREIKIEQ